MLVQDLKQQCEYCTLLDDYEIVVADDGSTEDKVLEENRSINLWSHCRLQENKQNVGLSVTRHNLVLQLVFPLILIIDSDAEVSNADYIEKYLQNAEKASVICGGILTLRKYLHKDNHLRFYYETSAAFIRTQSYYKSHPYEHFSAFNVLIHRSVFDIVNFDIKLSQYGYEDTLFGAKLKKHNISLVHIENPLIHTRIDSNESFLTKTETALQNLYKLRDELKNMSVLLRTCQKLENLHLIFLIRFWHHLFSRVERRQLLGHRPSLFLFKLYKLGYLSSLFS